MPNYVTSWRGVEINFLEVVLMYSVLIVASSYIITMLISAEWFNHCVHKHIQNHCFVSQYSILQFVIEYLHVLA